MCLRLPRVRALVYWILILVLVHVFMIPMGYDNDMK